MVSYQKRTWDNLPEEKKEQIKQQGRGHNLGNQFNRQWTTKALAELERLYWEEGLSLEDLSKRLDKPYGSVRYAMETYKIPRRNHSEAEICFWKRGGTEKISGTNNHNFGIRMSKTQRRKISEGRLKGKKPVIPYEERLRIMPEWYDWRKAIYQRDNYICQSCKATNTQIEPHHIKKVKDYPELAYEIFNGITLCLECHRLVNGREQEYEDYFQELLCPTEVIAPISL